MLTVTWPDGSSAAVAAIGAWGLHLTVAPAKARAGKLTGLLGNFDGDATNDLRVPGGPPIGKPSYDSLYPAFADGWRVTRATSLFSYAAGTGPDTYTDRHFPDRPVQPADLGNRAAAEALCARFGITDPQTLTDCVLDVTLTGQPAFAAEATATQQIVQDVPASTSTGAFTGTEATLTVSRPGETVDYQVDGTAGQRLYIQVLASTLRDGCGILNLRAPDHTTLASGCVIGGKGQIDGTILPTTGMYTVSLHAFDNGTGQARLRLVFSSDVHGTLTPGGSPTTVTIAAAGQVAELTFTGSAGQRVFVDVPDTSLPDQCGVLVLRGPDHATAGAGCVIGAKGYLDGTPLPVTGTYTLTVDPAGADTGQATLRLYATTDQHGTLTLDGPAVTGTVTQPGQVLDWSFDGVAGRTVTLHVTSTLPDQCGPLVLHGPDGSVVAGSCILGGTDNFRPVTLTASGRYTLVLDAADRTTGQATIQLRSG